MERLLAAKTRYFLSEGCGGGRRCAVTPSLDSFVSVVAVIKQTEIALVRQILIAGGARGVKYSPLLGGWKY